MSKPTGPTNPIILKLVQDLAQQGHKENSPFLLDVAEKLSVSRRQRAEVDMSKIQRIASDNEVIIVPGKVLSTGVISKKVTIAAANISEAASEKIVKAGGKIITIEELVKQNPKGTNVRIVI
jgi:large subunit ribosomal protein L18e